MKVRYKKTGSEAEAWRFNMGTPGEVLTQDDSPFITELDVWLPAQQAWKDMGAAFRDNDLITDNHNTQFFEPRDAQERARGFAL